ncbi:hypothetical protein HFN01_30390 [Rhizobium leguminosarum]|nr:hypothetical protein [Rhizobium leguminosarum]
MNGNSRKGLLAIWHLPDRYLRDGAELGAEFSAYRLDLALGALLQDLDRSAVSPPPGRYQEGFCHAALNSH